jgi:WD40-like Beta Propeller Repeat
MFPKKTRTLGLLLICASTAGAVAAACGDPGATAAVFVGDDASFPVGEGGTTPPFSDASPDDGPARTLTIQPADSTFDVTAAGQTTTLTALLDGAPVRVTWNLDSALTGTIDGAGVFTANAQAAGVVTVFAETAAHVKGQTTLTVRLHVTDNPGGVDPGTQGQLKGGGSADGTFGWLYPYDQTVFPRGLLPPTLQFKGVAATAYYVKVTSKLLTYEGFYAGSDPLRVAWTPTLWKTVTESALANDPVKVEITKASASGGDAGALAITGPISESWTVAQGSLKGIVYYNTYDSPLAQGDAGGGPDPNQGAVMRIKPGAVVPEVFLGGAARGSCTVCHTVSADGTTMSAAAGHKYDATYTISSDASAPSAPLSQKPDNTYSFGALTPDGQYLLSCGASALDGGPDAEAGAPPASGEFGPNVVSMTYDLDTKLFDTKTGNVVLAQILGGAVKKALMPAFSPDGKRVAFLHYEQTKGTGLSVLDFDQPTHTFSNLQLVVSDSTVTFGWPSFLPDGKQFVYMVGDRDDYATWRGGSGELLVADVPTKNATKLKVLNGVLGGKVYLQDPGEIFMNYEPTVLPVAEGGYYWVVFTSRRKFGNTITDPDPTDSVRKKLWVAAIDINAPANADPSHPAFYLEGQELASGNLRGFWALEPCRQTGNDCTSGSDCCTGFCRQAGDAGAFSCVAPPPTCAHEDEKCTKASDCCDQTLGFDCINGRCARPTPR